MRSRLQLLTFSSRSKSVYSASFSNSVVVPKNNMTNKHPFCFLWTQHAGALRAHINKCKINSNTMEQQIAFFIFMSSIWVFVGLLVFNLCGQVHSMLSRGASHQQNPMLKAKMLTHIAAGSAPWRVPQCTILTNCMLIKLMIKNI